jgi:hypothetical protein
MGKRHAYSRKNYESLFPGSGGHDKYAAIYESMRQSPAYKDLTGNQRDVLQQCFFQYGKRLPAKRYPEYIPYQKDTVFSLSWDMAKGTACQARKTFYQDMKALVSHGFIIVLDEGTKRRSAVYELSDHWKVWKQ